MIKKLLAGLGLTLAFAIPALAAEEITFGIISTESTQNLKKAWEPMLADLEKKIGVKVNAFFASDYAGIIEAQRFNKVQVAWYGNKSAIEAVDRSNGEVFVQTVAQSGNPGYWSYLVAHKDSPLNSIEDVKQNAKNLTLGMGDPNSTSGFLVPNYYAFAQNDIDPKTSFKTSRSANHETNLLAVANKQVDVATNNNENLERLKKTAPDQADKVKVIWKSPLIASDPFVWRKDLDLALKTKVKKFFLDYGKDDAREKSVLDGLVLAGFKESDNGQLLPYRQLALFSEKLKVEQDSNMSADDKKQKLAEINKKLAELTQQTAALQDKR